MIILIQKKLLTKSNIISDKKILQRVGIEGTYLNIIKAAHDRNPCYLILTMAHCVTGIREWVIYLTLGTKYSQPTTQIHKTHKF